MPLSRATRVAARLLTMKHRSHQGENGTAIRGRAPGTDAEPHPARRSPRRRQTRAATPPRAGIRLHAVVVALVRGRQTMGATRVRATWRASPVALREGSEGFRRPEAQLRRD